MGLLLNGNQGGAKKGLIVSGSEANFQTALQQSVHGATVVPDIMPRRTINNKASGLSKTAGGIDVVRNAPLFNDPRYTASTLAIPTDERTLHGLYRFFAETDPIVGAALKINTDLPLADLELGQCADSGVQQHYEDMWDRINGHKLLSDITSEYYEIGDAYPFGAFNETDYMWEQFALLNPDYVKVESTWINQKPLIKLIPEESLKKIVQTQSPRFIYDQLPDEIKQYVLFNQEIPLDPNNIFHIAHAKRPYELRGKSLIKRILKVLMLEDRFNQANFALATRHAVPLTVVKVGDPQSGWIPNGEELDEVRDLVNAYEIDPNFSIVYHYGIDVQYYGSSGKMLPIGPELERLYKLKFIGMGVHEQLLAGSGGTYSQAYVNLEVQRQRFLNLQLKLEIFMHRGLFQPVADLCGFYRVPQATAGYAGASKTSFGKSDQTQLKIKAAFTSVRDYQDNQEFKDFVERKAAETEGLVAQRDYVHPELDWGGMSASTDENLKNYIKWLAKERPHLIDDATLARMARLDRDTQEKAYIKDLERSKDRMAEISQLGLDAFVPGAGAAGGAAGGAGGGMDLGFGGGGDMGDLGGDLGGGGGDIGAPGAPIGADGPPEAADGTAPPPGAVSNWSKDLGPDIVKYAGEDDKYIISENAGLLKEAGRPSLEEAILKDVVNGK